jgi:hypothetical protein
MSWVLGGLAGLAVSILGNGQAGLGIVTGLLTAAIVYMIIRRRHRTRLTGESPAASRPADNPAA